MDLNKKVKQLNQLLETTLNKLPPDKKEQANLLITKLKKAKTPEELEKLKGEVIETVKTWQ